MEASNNQRSNRFHGLNGSAHLKEPGVKARQTLNPRTPSLFHHNRNYSVSEWYLLFSTFVEAKLVIRPAAGDRRMSCSIIESEYYITGLRCKNIEAHGDSIPDYIFAFILRYYSFRSFFFWFLIVTYKNYFSFLFTFIITYDEASWHLNDWNWKVYFHTILLQLVFIVIVTSHDF